MKTKVDVEMPVVITPRGLPGVKLGNDYVSVEYTCAFAQRFRWHVDLWDGTAFMGLTPPSPVSRHLDLQAGLCSLLYCMAMCGVKGDPPIKTLMRFPYGVTRWACSHHPELMLTVNELNNRLHAGERVIREPVLSEPIVDPGQLVRVEPVKCGNRDCE